MATNAPKSRKTHVIRIFGTNKKKEILHDIWADVERIDESRSIDVLQGIRQKLVRKFRWRDNPADTEEYLDPDLEDSLPENGPLAPKRKTVLVKVCDPDSEDLTDPEEWIPLRAIKKIRSKASSQQNNVAQLQYEKLINDDLAHSRVVEPRRILHYDTNIDDIVQKAIDDDPSLKAYVVKAENYTKDTETKDEDQWIEHEIVTKVIHKGNSVYYGDPNSSGTLGRQARKTKFLNQYLIDESEPAKLEKLGKNDINPPYRLDPYQNIINIQFSSSQAALLGLAPAPVVNNDFSASHTATSKDGEVWDSDQFGGQTSNAASGFGRTMVCAARQFIAFGKPTDGASCFIRTAGDIIERGVLNPLGELEWSVVGSLPVTLDDYSGAQSCSFAGGGFFISYLAGGSDFNNVYLAVSFDGTSFTSGINPFDGVDAAARSGDAAGDPNPIIGSVAYDKKTDTYVVTGRFNRHYLGRYGDAGEFNTAFVDTNFMSATSGNGLSWAPKFDLSEGAGFDGTVSDTTIEGSNGQASTVCFGRGRFVAATGYKVRFTRPGPTPSPTIVLVRSVCGVATSTDGVNWINHKLPGAVSALPDLSGNTLAIGFFKTRGTDEDGYPKGFFVAAGFEGSSASPVLRQTKLWTSSDGMTWTLVRTDSDQYGWVLSAINKSKGKVIRL